MKRAIFLALCALLIPAVAACNAQQPPKYETDSDLRALLSKPAAYPAVNFAVMTDLHTYDPDLGTEGKAFENYIAGDYKLTRESAEILQTAVGEINSENVSFVLVPGDLTDHGDRASHELVAQYLRQLQVSGKKVYVIPGNHDIENANAFKYAGDVQLRIRNITAEDFSQIYADFGYKDALYRDPASLSYVAEPQEGLWLLALDSARYRGKVGETETLTGGRFSPQTMGWIEDMLIKAAQTGKAVIAMEHHPVTEHFDGMATYFPEFVIENYQAVSRLFASYNVRLMFTGHFHAQDITERTWPDNKFLFDVETGSLVTYTCPYRVVNIDGSQEASIRSVHIQSIPSHPVDLQDYAKAQLDKGLTEGITAMITPYGVDSVEAAGIARDVARAMEAHMAGDEKLPAGQPAIQENGLSLRAWLGVQLKKGLVESLWKDLPPPDNNVTLDLKTGGWQ
ncbi:MAG: metallophosphoesterase [Dehalococcoidia bacterium]|jgi:3',5'-cyclic AMP phosphodiesterase CpdA